MIEDFISENWQIILIELGKFGIQVFLTWFALYEFYFKKNLEGQIKERVEKELNKHRLQLGHQYNRAMTDYSLYANKKHLAYAEVNNLIIKAESEIRQFYGPRSHPDLNEFNSEDLENYLKPWKLRKKVEEGFIKQWDEKNDKEKEELFNKIQEYLRKVEPQLVENSIWQAKNHFSLNIIYFSQELENLIKATLEDLFALLGIYKIWIEYTGVSNLNKDYDRQSKQAEALKKSIKEKIDDIIKKMKEELSSAQ